MGKHGNTHPRVERDHYPIPSWVTNALLEHVDVAGCVVWEPATGAGQMANVLKAAGAARVYCSDIAVTAIVEGRNAKVVPLERKR